MAKGEQLADLLPTAGPVDSVDVPTVDTPAEIDAETCEVLGANARRAGVIVPAPTSGTLALLEMIDSPFLAGGEATISDLFAVLYILHRGPEAVEPIYAAVRTRRALERAADGAFKGGDDAAAAWTANVHVTSLGLAQFDRCAMRFAQGLGIVDVAATVGEVREALHRAMGGFRMFPESAKGEPEKKTAQPLTPPGWRGWLRRCVRWPISRRPMSGGNSR
jgi:hypothetical protein